MQLTDTGHITRAEWRWLSWVSLALLLLTFLPFIATIAATTPESDWGFMGAFHDYQDNAAHLARVQQGREGQWLVRLLHTPEPHRPALVQPVYALLGTLSGWSLLTPEAIFHIARLTASLFMYTALYQLGANIWTKIRTRRIFFLLVVLGSGLGWLNAFITGQTRSLDLTHSQAYPFFATIANVHEPLTIACLALMMSVSIGVLRPGVRHNPDIDNGGPVVLLTALILALIYPETLLPLSLALITGVVFIWRDRGFSVRELRWLLWTLAPALPILIYLVLSYQDNPVIVDWLQQRAPAPPSLWLLLVSLGIPLLVGLPGLYRALRYFEPDGDRLMLAWLIAMLLLMFLPVPIHTLFLAGLMLPLAYFATRALEDTWFRYIRRRWRYRILAAGLPLVAISHLFVLVLPVVPLWEGFYRGGMVLEPDYQATFQYLERVVVPGDVVLASPDASVWLPFWTGARVVYGHPDETANAAQRRQQVLNWYQATDSASCERLLYEQAGFRVRFVIHGPREHALGAGTCQNDLRLVATFGRVSLYATRLNQFLP